jgi:hypothetical protein
MQITEEVTDGTQSPQACKAVDEDAPA